MDRFQDPSECRHTCGTSLVTCLNAADPVHGQSQKSFFWFLINWTEPEFFAGPISTIFLMVGAVTVWQLSIRKSKHAGIEICYGSAHIWPWVFASQILSLLLTEYLFGYLHLNHPPVSA